MWLLQYRLFYLISFNPYLPSTPLLSSYHILSFQPDHGINLILTHHINFYQLYCQSYIILQFKISMQGIFTKSMLKFNPNSKELSQLISFTPLVTIQNDKLVIHPKGLKVIESQVLGNVHLIALEGERQNLLYNFYKSNHILGQFGQQRKESGIWISTFPRYDRQKQTLYLYLQTCSVNYEQRIRIHNICSLICSCVFVGMEQTNLWYLASVEGRIVYSRDPSNEREDKDNRKKQLAHLILYNFSTARLHIEDLKGAHNQIYDYLNEKKIYLECESTYKSLNMYKISAERIEAQAWDYVEKLEDEVKQLCDMPPQKTEELLSGPMLSWYLEEIVQSLNTSQNVQIERCINRIEIQEGYNGFLKGVEIYHQRVRREMKEQGIPNLKEVLQIAREEAMEQYKRQSSDAEYLIYLGDYLDAKDSRLTQENNKIFDLRNINYLKMESDSLLDRVVKEKMDQATASRELDKLSERYNSTAVGDNKYQLYSNYSKYLSAAVYKTVNERDSRRSKKELHALNEEKKQLEARIKSLEHKQKKERDGGCCSSCQVM